MLNVQRLTSNAQRPTLKDLVKTKMERWLASFGRDDPDGFGKSMVFEWVHRSMHDDGAGRICSQIVPVLPVALRANGPRTKAAAAIGADVIQNNFDAGTTERAFEGTNHRGGGIRWKRHLAVLASRSELKHGSDFELEFLSMTHGEF